MHGYYGHTLKIVNSKGEWNYAQFHLISDQGTANFTADEAAASRTITDRRISTSLLRRETSHRGR